MTHRKASDDTRTGHCSGMSLEDTCLLAMRCPVYRRRDPGFRTELEVGDGKGKGTSGDPTRPKVPRRRPGSDCPIVVMKPGNAGGAGSVSFQVRTTMGCSSDVVKSYCILWLSPES